METRELLAWGLAALMGLLVLSSFTGYGTGLFGWGIMMGTMWLWMLLPLLLVILLIIQFSEHPRNQPPATDQEDAHE